MKNNIFFSIVIPVYNAEDFLAECLDSLVGQHYTNFEIILVNDGSTDNSLEIANGFAKNDRRFKIISQRNSGVSTARNSGIKNSKGEYILFVDADDYIIDSNALLKISQLIDGTHDVDLIMFPMKYENNRKIDYIEEGKYNLKDEFSEQLRIMARNEELNSPCNKIYRNKIIKDYDLGFAKDIKIGEDLLFNIEYIRNSKSVYYLNKELYFYRTSNENSATSRYLDNKYNELMTVNTRMRNWTEEIGDNKLIATSNYIRLKNILSCLKDFYLPTYPYGNDEREEQLKVIRINNQKIIVKECGLIIYMISVIYSFIDIRLLARALALIHGVRK